MLGEAEYFLYMLAETMVALIWFLFFKIIFIFFINVEFKGKEVSNTWIPVDQGPPPNTVPCDWLPNISD